jgi:hypothetical protein
VPIATYGITLSTGGVNIQKTGSRIGDGLITREITLPAGKAGTLTTRTDDDTGVVTSNGHGILDTDTVAVFWNGGRRYGVDVTAVDANTVSINAGAGNILPIATTAVVIVKQVAINVSIDGDAIQLVGISFEFLSTAITDDGHVTFKDAAADVIAEIDLEPNTPQIYDIAGGQANPFTGDPITNAYAFNGCATADATLKIISLEDSTP